MMKFFTKIKKFFANTIIIVLVTFMLFEIVYRYAIIDLYKAEMNGLNPKEVLQKPSIDFLWFGDSFSATSSDMNYIDKFRVKNPSVSIVNASVPGTGIRQVNTFASGRIKKHQPKAIVYQIYVGNDLIDVNHFWNWEKFSAARNLYWEASDHFLSLSYINRKLAILNVSKEIRSKGMLRNDFSADLYDIRTKRFIHNTASYLNNTILLETPFKKRYAAWLVHMNSFLEMVPEDIPVYLLWIPHCAQVNDYYLQNMESLGAEFKNKHIIQQQNYPFITAAKKDLSAFENVKHLNPLEFFRQNDMSTNHVYFVNDPHLNKHGNIVLSEFLQQQLPFKN